MFSRDNHDGKENYKREREDRLEHIEKLNRKAQDEFNDSFFNRSDKFNDFHKNNNNYIHEDEHFTYHSEEEDNRGSGKKIILSIVALGALGVLGYLGFNHSNSNQTPNACVEQNTKNNNEVKPADKLEISQKIISSQNIKNIQEEPIPTRTPEPIVTPNEENKIVTAMAKPISKPTSKPSEENLKSVEPTNPPEEKTDIKNMEHANSSTENSNIKKSDKVEKTEHKEEKKSKIVTNKKRVVKKAKKPQYRVVTVKKGDTLASLAEKYYGNPMDFQRIVRVNRDIRGSHSHLHPGQKVIIPIITHSKNARLVRVRSGDTLYSIAKRYYGSSRKYQKIIDANYKIKNIHTRLHVGEVIRVPR